MELPIREGPKAQQAQAPYSTSFPELPSELRNGLWMEVFQSLPNFIETNVTYLILNFEEGTVEEQSNSGVEHHFVDVIGARDQAKFFQHNTAAVPKLLHDLLGSICDKTTFSFTTPTSLLNFVELLTGHADATLEYSMPVRVAVYLFHDRSKFKALAAWKKVDMCHGYAQGAAEHVKEWASAVQSLPAFVSVHFVACQPWRDYRAFRAIAQTLQPREIQVGLDKSAWAAVPDPQFHMAMTVASLRGLPMVRRDAITRDMREEMIKYGCRGFSPDQAPAGAIEGNAAVANGSGDQ